MATATVTAAEIADCIGKSTRWVNILANKEGWQAEKLNGRGDRRFIIEGLPVEIQEMLMRRRCGIERDDLEEMVRNFEVKVPPEKLKDPAVGMKVRMVCECLAVPKKAHGRDGRIEEIAQAYGYHKGTAYRLMKRVRKGQALVKGSRNHGVSFKELGVTLRAWDEEAGRMAIEAIIDNRREHVEKLTLYNKVRLKAEARRLKVGSYRSFCHLAARIDGAVKVYRDKGKRGLREDIIPAIRRDHTAYRAMECLVGDQHKADYYCFDHNGEVATLELFCWLDFRTQMVWPAISYKHYNRFTVGQALINAVRWGLPSVVYTDWGKPEESDYITLLLDQLTGLGVKARDIRHTHAKVRHPQAKPIEGWFGRLDKNLRNEMIPGYCKRLKDTRENELQQKEKDELIKTGGLLSIEELIERITSVIQAWNEHQFKNRGPDTGKSPHRIYLEETGRHPVTTLSEDVLDYIFLPMQEVICRRSQVKVKHPWLKTLTYYSPDLSGYGGEAVQVRFDPFDGRRAWVFHRRKLIAMTEEWNMVNPKDRDRVADRIEQQNRLVKQIEEKYRRYAPGEVGGMRLEAEGQKSKAIPRIHPQEREARQLRIMRTSLDELVDAETGEILEVAAEERVEVRSHLRGMFGGMSEVKKAEKKPRLFSVNMDRPHEE